MFRGEECMLQATLLLLEAKESEHGCLGVLSTKKVIEAI